MARQRGLAEIGVELDVPVGVELLPIDSGPIIVRCSEVDDGRPRGALEVELFRAALVIDRDGILREKVVDACTPVPGRPGRATVPIAVSLPGASGFRATLELGSVVGAPRPALPFVYVFAIAPHDLGVDGGALVTVRTAARAWPSADQILRSLKVYGRRRASTNESTRAIAEGNVLSLFPLVGD